MGICTSVSRGNKTVEAKSIKKRSENENITDENRINEQENKENKKIIEEAKPNKENKELFCNLLKTKCKIIYNNYANNQKNFIFKEKIVEITKFKTLDDIMKENIENKNKKRKIKRKSENKIKRKYVKSNEPYGSEFKKESLELIKHLSDGYFDPRNAKRKNIFIIFKTIPKLEEYIEK